MSKYFLIFCLFVLLCVPFIYSEQINFQVLDIDENDDTLELKLKIKDNSPKIILNKNKLIRPSAPVYIYKNSKFNEIKIDEDFEVYQSVDTFSSFIKFNDSTILGCVRVDDKELWVQVEDGNSGNRQKRDARNNRYSAVFFDGDNKPKVDGRKTQQQIQVTDEMKAFLIDQSANKMNYIVEVLLFIDYTVYQKWKSTAGDKAVSTIRSYYSAIVNAMDLRYKSLNQSDFSVSVKLAGFVIATTEADSSWTLQYTYLEGDYTYVDAYKVLDHFPTWLDNNFRDIPAFDNILIFTDRPLKGGTMDNGRVRFISGLANIGAICNHFAISLNMDSNPFALTGTAAHELAHNLGSLHDSITKNSCDAEDQYIMSPAPGSLNLKNSMNPFKFSPCSIDYIRTYLGALSLMKKNCLLQTSYNPDLDGIPVDKPIGQFVDLDRQCQLHYGVHSFYCAGMKNDLSVCSSLYCWDDGRCKGESRAANGTTCGMKKWCYKGNCIYNEEAPEDYDFCRSGDYKGLDLDCRIEVAKVPSQCYVEHFELKCCASCHAIKEPYTNCAYGDRIPTFCESIKQYQCYDVDIKTQCCKSCEIYKNDFLEKISCEYGDKTDWCHTSHPSLCYRDTSTCCRMCYYSHYSDVLFENCQYLDKAEYCSTIDLKNCVHDVVAKDCCYSCNETLKEVGVRANAPELPYDPPVCPTETAWCRRLPPFACYDPHLTRVCPCNCEEKRVSSIKDCEWGDRQAWCIMVKYCDKVKNPLHCCHTCSQHKSKKNSQVTNQFPLSFAALFVIFVLTL